MFKVSILDIKTASLLFQDMVKCVILPGEEGELSVMDFHHLMIAKLKKGTVKADRYHMSIEKGIAKAEDNELVILAERQDAGI